MTKVITTGRTDLGDYFKLSGSFDGSKLNHTPFLAFIVAGDTVQVQLVFSSKDLLNLPDETPIMGQWRGTWNSDFFQFTVGDYRQFLERQSK